MNEINDTLRSRLHLRSNFPIPRPPSYLPKWIGSVAAPAVIRIDEILRARKRIDEPLYALGADDPDHAHDAYLMAVMHAMHEIPSLVNRTYGIDIDALVEVDRNGKWYEAVAYGTNGVHYRVHRTTTRRLLCSGQWDLGYRYVTRRGTLNRGASQALRTWRHLGSDTVYEYRKRRPEEELQYFDTVLYRYWEFRRKNA